MGNCLEEAVTHCDAVVAWDAIVPCESVLEFLSC